MARLKIKKFGPIKNGYTDSKDGFFEVGKLSIFVGEQGAGKSTIAKLFSSLVWLEKAILSLGKTKSEVSTQTYLKKLLSFHRIDSFCTDKSIVEFKDDFIKIKIADKKIDFELLNKLEYTRPQIQYIPSERNLAGVVNRFSQLRMMPDSLQNFLSVYDDAIRDSEMQDSDSPIGNLKVRYSKRKEKTEIYTKDYSMALDEAASGFQSAVPLFMVTKYFSDSIKKLRNEYKFKSVSEQKKFTQEYQKLMKQMVNSYSKDLEEPFFNSPQKNEIFFSLPVGDEPFFGEPDNHNGDTFKNFVKRTINSCFYNIVEEPEQNLFPNSQKSMVLFLLRCLNENKRNSLVVTTHSPYVMETINNCIYAGTLQQKGIDAKSALPISEQLNYDDVFAYAVKNGKIVSIKADDIKQIDPSEIDECSKDINDVYSKLCDMEYGVEN
jgi:predicted ATPase